MYQNTEFVEDLSLIFNLLNPQDHVRIKKHRAAVYLSSNKSIY